MPIWTKILSQKEVEATSDLVIEATVSEIRSENIPAIYPSVSGDEIVLRDAKVIRQDNLGTITLKEIASTNLPLSFWTYSGYLTCKEGDRIRVSLVLHLNSEGKIVLMPQHCSYHSVVDLKENSLFIFKPHIDASQCSKEYGPVKEGPPVCFNFGVFSEMYQYKDYFDAALERWKAQGAPDAGVTECTLNPCYVPRHYGLVWGEIAPCTMKLKTLDAQTLAYTIVLKNKQRPGKFSSYEMRFNKNVDWKQFDMISVMKHEIGHAYGLGHSPDKQDVMFSSLAPREIRDVQRHEAECARSMYPNVVLSKSTSIFVENKPREYIKSITEEKEILRAKL